MPTFDLTWHDSVAGLVDPGLEKVNRRRVNSPTIHAEDAQATSLGRGCFIADALDGWDSLSQQLVVGRIAANLCAAFEESRPEVVRQRLLASIAAASDDMARRVAWERLRVDATSLHAEGARRRADASRMAAELAGGTTGFRRVSLSRRLRADGVEPTDAARLTLTFLRRLMDHIGGMGIDEWSTIAARLVRESTGTRTHEEPAADLARIVLSLIGATDAADGARLLGNIEPGDCEVASRGPGDATVASRGPGSATFASSGPGKSVTGPKTSDN